ncbi:MAG TPA: hypothetical protein VI336_01310 [Candidatus Saccharimonadales bacterium]|nr:hypothetical protein [Candidatus Saccharimonadales bacterium]
MPRLWLQAAGSALAVLLVVATAMPTAFADTKPYFRTLNGGPFVGGWFNSGSDSCSSSDNYQRPTYGGTVSNEYRGALMAYTDLGSRRGALSNLDAFATGLIEGPASGFNDQGFLSGLTGAPPSPNGSRSLSFNNAADFGLSAFWGGLFEGSASLKTHCVPDYFEINNDSITGAWNAGNFSNSGFFSWAGGNLTNGSDRTVSSATRLVIFVNNANVIIDRNITYGSNSISNVPKFALVVRGNIYVTPNVGRLDGWYIAQPTSGTTGGEIWTCRNGNTVPSDSWMRDNCGNDLDVNGAFTAKQVNLGRIVGNVGTNTPAEDINFSAPMVLGGPFFEGDNSSTGGAIQSLISLPPVF